MHSGDLSELEKSNLSEQEKEALLQVMQRAKVSGISNATCAGVLGVVHPRYTLYSVVVRVVRFVVTSSL